MQYPKFRFVFDRKRVATKTKKGLVQLEVYSEGRRVFVSTGIKVYADQWKDTRKVINTPLAVSLNRTLDAMMQKFVDWAASLYAGGGEFDFDKLQRFLSSGNEGKTSFIDFVSSRLEERSDIRESTRKSQHKLIPSLRAFGHIKYFADLTKENIVKYDEYLHKKGYKQQTVHSYHKFMKIYINEAIRLGLMERNPYEGIKIERGKSELRKYLTQEELLRIQNAVIANVSICKVRDLFLFQCYTGFAYADLAAFDFGNVVQRNGKYVVHDARKKTGENFYVVLMAPAVDILRKYDFKVEENDIREAAEGMIQYQYAMYGIANVPKDIVDEAVVNMLHDRRQVDRLAEQVEDRKVMEKLKGEITLKSTKITSDKFRELK